MNNSNVTQAIMELLKLDQAGKIPANAPVSFSFEGHEDEEYPGESAVDPSETGESGELPEGKIGVVQESPIDEDAQPMLAAVLRKSAVPVKAEPLKYSNGAMVTRASQKKPGLPPVKKK